MRNSRDVNGDLDDLNGYLVRRVNLHAEAMRRMNLRDAIKYVCGIIERNDIVIGVFVETGDPEGIEVRVIKGAREMQAVAFSGRRDGFRIDAVQCDPLKNGILAPALLADDPRTRH